MAKSNFSELYGKIYYFERNYIKIANFRGNKQKVFEIWDIHFNFKAEN